MSVHSLAIGMVEATTEYDFAELPDHLQQEILRTAGDLMEWMEARRVVVDSSATIPSHALTGA